MTETFDLFQSRLNRDQAMKSVLENAEDFKERFYAWFETTVAHDSYVRFEELRHRAIEAGIKPHKPGAWGACANALKRWGKLVDTGTVRPMEDPKSNARKTSVYRVNQMARIVLSD